MSPRPSAECRPALPPPPSFWAACRVPLLAAPDGPCGLRLPSALGRPRIQGEGREASGAGAHWTSRCKGGGGPPGAGGDTVGAPSSFVNGPSQPRLPPAYMLAEAGILQPPLPRQNMCAPRPPLLPLLPPRAVGAGSACVYGASLPLPLPPLAPLPSPPLMPPSLPPVVAAGDGSAANSLPFPSPPPPPIGAAGDGSASAAPQPAAARAGAGPALPLRAIHGGL